MKVLLAIEDSEFSEAAANALMKQVRPPNAEIRVLHVVETTLGDFQSQDVFEGARRAKIEHAKELVGRFDKRLKDAGYASTPAVEEGDAKRSIVEFAEKWKPDFIFLGSHGRRGWKRLALGSVSEAVARHAHCSVVIVRPEKA